MHDDALTARLLTHARAVTDDPDPQLCRGRTNVVVAAGPLVFRAPRTGHRRPVAEVVEQLTRAAAAAALAPVLCGPALPAPIDLAGVPVTVWPRLTPTRPSALTDVTAAMWLLHAADPRTLAPETVAVLPVWDPARTVAALTHLLDPGLAADLADRAAHGARTLRRRSGPEVLVHHDAKRPNVVVTAGGPRLVDLDGVCLAPALLDLAISFAFLAEGELAEADLLASYPGARRWATAGAPLADATAVRLARALRRVDQLAWQARTAPEQTPAAAADTLARLERALA